MLPEPKSLSQRVTQPKGKAQPKSAANDKNAKSAAAGTAGKPVAKKGRGGRAAKTTGRPSKKTAEELDSEMADYFDAAKVDTNGAAPINGDAPMEDEIM